MTINCPSTASWWLSIFASICKGRLLLREMTAPTRIRHIPHTTAQEFLDELRRSNDVWWPADGTPSPWVFRGVGNADELEAIACRLVVPFEQIKARATPRNSAQTRVGTTMR